MFLRRIAFIVSAFIWFETVGVAFKNEFDGAQWFEAARLDAPSGQLDDAFGRTLALSGDTLAVGAPEDFSQAFMAGAVHVYQRDAGGPDAWGEVVQITDPSGQFGDDFGATPKKKRASRTKAAAAGATAAAGSRAVSADGGKVGEWMLPPITFLDRPGELAVGDRFRGATE